LGSAIAAWGHTLKATFELASSCGYWSVNNELYKNRTETTSPAFLGPLTPRPKARKNANGNGSKYWAEWKDTK